MALTQVQGGMILPSTTLTTPIVATTMGVGGATPSTSGAGITFPATQSASTDANTLDDYEEGTWTPTIAFGGASAGVGYDNQKGTYTKIGNRVFISCYVALNSKGSSTGVVTIRGLPFTSANVSNQYNNIAIWGNTLSSITGGLQGYNGPNSTFINEMAYVGTGSQTILTNSNVNNSSDFMVNFSYPI